jgi:hypothetical protein
MDSVFVGSQSFSVVFRTKGIETLKAIDSTGKLIGCVAVTVL